MKKIALALGAAALISAPVVAQSLPTVAPVSDESEIGGGSTGIIVGILGAGILGLAILGISDGDDVDDLPPVSP